ncbi:MAG: GEVED domain-containing protein [Kiritimatiellia bacterium]
MVRGASATVDVVASTSGYLNSWADHNQNGSWGDPGEQVVVDSLLSPGTNYVPWATPPNAQLGVTFCRVRFCSYAGLSYTGLATDGEVEDYELTIYQNGPDTNNFEITNVVNVATNQTTIWWVGDTGVVYETQYVLDLPSTASPPWTAWGPWVTGEPLMQVDTNATATAKHYRVVAPYSPPPP